MHSLIPRQKHNWFTLKYIDAKVPIIPLFINKTEFYFYIRGHIRNSFKTDRLKKFINLLILYFPNVKIVLQTWNYTECQRGASWRRNIQYNRLHVTKKYIDSYFKNPKITSNIMIIDENTVNYNGKTDGKICKSMCPTKGWKNMWYGIYKGLEQIPSQDRDKMVVSFRYDYFDVPTTQVSSIVNENTIIQFIHNNLDTSNIQFLLAPRKKGVDNLYMGGVDKIKTLVDQFYFELDNITTLFPNVYSQEFLVPVVSIAINK